MLLQAVVLICLSTMPRHECVAGTANDVMIADGFHHGQAACERAGQIHAMASRRVIPGKTYLKVQCLPIERAKAS